MQIQADFPTILLQLVNAMFRDGDVDLTAEPRALADVVANEVGFGVLGVGAAGVRLRPRAWPPLFRICFIGSGDGLLPVVARPCRSRFGICLPNRTLAANASGFTARWRTGME